MVGYLFEEAKKPLLTRVRPVAVRGLPLAGVSVPRGRSGPVRVGWALARRGIRRAVAGPDFSGWDGLAEAGVLPVDPLPLCRAVGAGLALALLAGVPLRQRRVALRGERAGEARSLAGELCPRVGELLLDFDRGEEDLSRCLRAVYGAAPLHLGWGEPPQVSVELSPRAGTAGRTLRLWGVPDLAGLELTLLGGEALPLGVASLPMLALLWESGRVRREELEIRESGKAP